ncbi:MAG: type II secretion system F family protein, partial [Candidatus Nanohaloarchaea archaeon]|nr:type II secretion system F family protein [Candidatus Nanohaloarchaea archaeon]
GTFMAFYLYPTVRVGERRSNIDNNLPFATMYLSTIAGTGTPPAAIFDLLGDFDEYGEVSEEARNISRDIYTFGAGTTEALRSAAQRTPSDKFKELLWGVNSILTTGGDLRAYLREKSEAFMADYRRSLDEFTDTLSLLVEMYITLVIVGSVFLITISTIMSTLGGNSSLIVAIQIFTVVILLPLSAIMFIVIVKGVSPLE